MSTAEWTLSQHLDRMAPRISEGKTCRRAVLSLQKSGIGEDMLVRAVERRAWRVAQIGTDYVFAPGDYTIRPIA